MKRVAIVQARMTSTRLPGKVLLPLAGEPMLSRQIARMRRATTLDDIIVATTTNATDDAIVRLCQELDVNVSRGSEHDVLRRYAEAAAQTQADLVVRITSDCPLIDAGIIDRVVTAASLAPRRCDYASNTLERTYPRGLDVEALYRDALDRADREAVSAAAREHVTYHLYAEAAARYRLCSVVDTENHADLRWTVDTPEDFALIERIYALVGPDAPYRQLLDLVADQPSLATMNANVVQKPVVPNETKH